MNAIDPKTPVSEILQQYPETLAVFRAFGMKCAGDSSFAAKTLEENFVAEQVNFMDLLSQLNKVINPAKSTPAESSPTSKIEMKTEDARLELDVSPEIGNIVSQHTSAGEKFKLMAVMNFWGCMGIMALFFFMIPVMYISPVKGIAFILAICAGVAAIFYFRKETVGIVGTQGFALYKISKRTQRVASHELYLFKDANELIIPQTVSYLNGVYTGTSFKFKLQQNEKVLYGTSGKYFNLKHEAGKYGWKFPFLQAIENAWTSFLTDSLLQKLRTEGSVQFMAKYSMLADQPVELGVNYIKYKGLVFSKGEIQKMYFDNGMLHIEHRNFESKYLGMKTKGDQMVIPVNEMPNQKVFLALLNYL